MTRVLVVDDSRIDRDMVGALLQAQANADVVTASNGLEALQRMEAELPDLVLTDLQMPEMDGLALVDAIRERHPTVPVVLMTAHGSEEIAVEALRRGAASYVPKRKVAEDLVPTAKHVLSITRARREEARVLACLKESEHVFVLDNDPAYFPARIALCREQLQRRGLTDDTGLMQVSMALDEALANALHHGNLEVSSTLREKGLDVYFEEVEKRRTRDPYRDRRIFFTARVAADEACYVIRDEGKGFDPSTIPDPTDPANLEKASGRGLLLIRTFMDEISFRDGGREIVMVKRRGAEADSQASTP